jgi:hypothetical protein
MKRFLPHLCCASGLLLVVVGLIWPGTSYQDPTPEMSLLAEKQSERLTMLAIAGFVLFMTGTIWIIARWLSTRFSRKTVK